MGRPRKPYNARVADEVIAGVASGLDFRTACDAAGISGELASSWIVESADFSLSFKKAKASHIRSCLTRLKDLPAGRWQAAAWELERIYPERFGQGLKPAPDSSVKVEVSAQVCAAMTESWKTFVAQVVVTQQVSQLGLHNMDYVSSSMKAMTNPTDAGTCADSDARETQATDGGVK